jgi:glycosyltransferase involved in cell wall biosynthesis
LPEANWVETVYHGLPATLHRLGPGDGGYVAFLGRIAREKRPDLAIRIAREAGVHLKIAAKVDKPDREYFRTVVRPLLVGPGVEVLGEISEADKTAFLGNAAALLFPIDWPEPFGLVMIESMACGTPVVAFPCGSVPEIIDEGVTGFVVRGVDEAVGAIGRARSADRAACRRRFEERFTASEMTRRYLDVYARRIHDVPPAPPAAGADAHTEGDTPHGRDHRGREQVLHPGRILPV